MAASEGISKDIRLPYRIKFNRQNFLTPFQIEKKTIFICILLYLYLALK